jgi:hypothetical protein
MLYAKHDSNKPGSDYTCICRDLKTVRGVQNRLIKGAWPSGTWRIYNCLDSDWYKATGHFLVGKLHKA